MPAEAASAASAASINWNDRARHWAKAAPAGAPTASAMQINRNLIACARLKPGDHVLDLASDDVSVTDVFPDAQPISISCRTNPRGGGGGQTFPRASKKLKPETRISGFQNRL